MTTKPTTGKIRFSLPMDTKNRFVQSAHASGKTLVEWILETCEERVKKEEAEQHCEQELIAV